LFSVVHQGVVLDFGSDPDGPGLEAKAFHYSPLAFLTHLVRVSERADLRCIAFDQRRLPLVQQFCDPHSRQRKDSLLHSTFDAKTLTGSGGPTERHAVAPTPTGSNTTSLLF
jgi:hypothetical protein